MEETQGVKSPDAPLDTEALKREAAVAERNRILEIHKITLSAKLDVALEDQHTKAGTSIDEFRKIALNALAERSEADAKSTPTQTHHVDLVRDEQDMRHELMSSALTGRMNPGEFKDDRNNQFIGMTLMRFAEESVRLQHHMNRIPRRDEVIKLAMQTTSDFANVLENVARKQLLAQYNLVQPTYKLWTKPSTTPDFKTMTRNRLSEAPTFLKVPEGGQITIGSMTDSKESYAISTYGRGVSFTRQMLINDDLGAFNDIIGMFGAQAARLENKTVYAILNANANMADSAALFVAGHGNLGAGVIANTALDAMFTAMGIQKGVDGVSVLNLTPKFLIVPKAKEATARAALVATGPNVKASDANWFAGRLEPVADAELDGTSTAVWYGACDPAIAPGIEYAHLEGANGPQFIREDNDQGILGVQFYAFLDFGAKAVDWRPLYKSSGS